MRTFKVFLSLVFLSNPPYDRESTCIFLKYNLDFDESLAKKSKFYKEFKPPRKCIYPLFFFNSCVFHYRQMNLLQSNVLPLNYIPVVSLMMIL